MIPRRWVPTALWAAVVLAATSVPGGNVPDGPAGVDKLVHLALYGVLGTLAARAALAGHPARRGGALLRLLAGIALFAAADELHQSFIPGRSADPRDWIADMIGATVAIALTAAARQRREPST